MIPFLNRALSAGVVQMLDGLFAPSDTVINGCQGYSSNKVLVATNPIAGTPIRNAGCAYLAGGILYVVDATAGNPAGYQVIDGLAVSSTGQLCYTTNGTDSTTTYLGGMAVNPAGAVHASVA